MLKCYNIPHSFFPFTYCTKIKKEYRLWILPSAYIVNNALCLYDPFILKEQWVEYRTRY